MPKITAAVVEAATLPPGKSQAFIRDDDLRGFALKIGKVSKTFIVEARTAGKVRRKVIGDASLMTVTSARKQAKLLLAKYADGVDPSKSKKLLRADKITLAEAFDFKVERSDLKPTTVASYRDVVFRRLVDWKDRPLSSITPNEWIDHFLKEEAEVSLASALVTKRALAAIWNHARSNLADDEGEPILRASPTRLTYARTNRPSTVDPKQRPIENLPKWLEVIYSQKRTDKFQPFVEIALRTGCRRNELATLTWSQVDFENRLFHLPNTKNGKPHTVYMSHQTEAAFRLLWDMFGDTPYVFGVPIYDPKKPFLTASKAYGSTHSPHDCRSTFINLCEEAGITETVSKALVNHRERKSVTDHYKKAIVGKQIEAVQAVSDFIDEELQKAKPAQP